MLLNSISILKLLVKYVFDYLTRSTYINHWMVQKSHKCQKILKHCKKPFKLQNKWEFWWLMILEWNLCFRCRCYSISLAHSTADKFVIRIFRGKILYTFGWNGASFMKHTVIYQIQPHLIIIVFNKKQQKILKIKKRNSDNKSETIEVCFYVCRAWA